MTVTSPLSEPKAQSRWGLAGDLFEGLNSLLARIPGSAIALLARFSIAAVFWKSGQTKVSGFAIDIVEGRFELGIPRFSDSVVDLFRDEYQLPLIAPEVAAFLAATAEHVFPALILIGLATRLSAFALLVMTVVIQIFVYPSAYALHGVWAVVLLYLIKSGPGLFSLDQLLTNRRGKGTR
jgi:putative oxidoreductase